jgi:hypothetical protein
MPLGLIREQFLIKTVLLIAQMLLMTIDVYFYIMVPCYCTDPGDEHL